MRKSYWLPAIGFCLLIFSSCDSRRVFEENREIADNAWDVNNKVVFEVDITDTLSQNNFYVNVRNADGYPYSNLYLFITTNFPDGHTRLDTMECILADDKGKWLGSGLGDIWDNQIPWRRGIRFPRAGKYTFTYQHAMRVDVLPLIMDVGLRIERAE